MACSGQSRIRRLSELLAGIAAVSRACDRDIRGLSQDSRCVQPGWLFVAVPGQRVDGRDYIADATTRGAVAVVFEPAGTDDMAALSVPALAVIDLKFQAGIIADRFYGSPSKQLQVIGVTGTNGKTTCTHLLAQALEFGGARCGLIGTLGSGFFGALKDAAHTTPDAIAVHRQLAEFLAAGAAFACIEVSSHGMDQGRVKGVAFDTAVFTNLSQDHLDYHGDMVAYGLAKSRLFTVPGLQNAVINVDDDHGRALLKRTRGQIKTLSYGVHNGEIRAETVTPRPNGLDMCVVSPRGQVVFHAPLIGHFNAANVLAVLATLSILGVALEDAARRLSRVKPVAGRMECFGGDAVRPLVVVDYAHTPDALEKVLMALREHTTGRLFCVFGCGGDRDRGKRPLMGEQAERFADTVVLTDDNPRHESPAAIVAEIRAGMRREPRVIHDRVAAIHWVLNQAGASDVVLVAGKGHEESQQIGDHRRPLSDRRTVVDLLGLAA